MKAIDLSTTSASLEDVLGLAAEENVVLKTAEGRRFVLAEIDDFGEEVAAASQNKDLMKLLDERSKEGKTFTLSEVRKRLRGPTRKRGVRP